MVYRYANEIFHSGRELTDVLKGRTAGRPVRLVVGISDGLPKLTVHRLLQPALRLPEPVQIICHEGRPEQLLAELAISGLDLVLMDAPASPAIRVRAFSHLLGSSGTSFFGVPALAAKYRKSSRLLSTERRSCCRSTIPRFDDLWSNGSTRKGSTRGRWESFRMALCSRLSVRPERVLRRAYGDGEASSPAIWSDGVWADGGGSGAVLRYLGGAQAEAQCHIVFAPKARTAQKLKTYCCIDVLKHPQYSGVRT